MWLLPQLPRLSRWITSAMHRMTTIEGTIPADGPALLVANHPNALIDPVVVTAAAGRPVRWLAKSTLVYQPLIGWLFRAAGAIPVYRRQDDASQMDRNADTFAAAVEAMRSGSVVALFPEGISHDLPGLAPMKTGAARLALQTSQALGRTIPIIPVGVIYEDASIFLSRAGVVIGAPLAWDDLGTRGPDDREAVEQLTERIGTALGTVTRQLDSWADQPIVEHAAAVVAATTPAGEPPPSWIARASGVHNLMEDRADPALPGLRVRVQQHARALRRLGITPAQLVGQAPAPATHWWSGWRAPFVGLLWLIGIVWCWIPYHCTAPLVRLVTDDRDVIATIKAVVGFLLFSLWIVATAVAIGLCFGWGWGLVALPLSVALALWTLRLEEARLAAHSAERAAQWRVRTGEQVQRLLQEQTVLAAELTLLADLHREDSSASKDRLR